MCIWFVNMLTRFAINHPELLYLLISLSVIIPTCHVRNHQEYCWYIFGNAYMPSVGHFFGETAEYIWPFLN
jgi:hypothetical protein